ncbi:MAG: hypothetical protein IJ560_04580 [Alphaproteobacteria bacterium]|nr:hypothetical protein [Alphaproteobacteria bacterium]
MVVLKRIFACLSALMIMSAALAENDVDTVRAAARRVTTNAANATTASHVRTKSSVTQKTPSASARSNTSGTNTGRATTATPRVNGDIRSRTTVAVKSRDENASQRAVSNRTGVARTTTPARTTTVARTANAPRTIKTTTSARTATAARTATRARAADTTTTTTRTREDVMNRNYSKCREVYNSCMDEFCANKDAQLKRCACSSRATEFSNTKKQLERVEDKMLSFNQRLLAVGMDAADVTAMNTATAGEDAYNNTKDRTESQKQLDAIAKRLNTSFSDSNFGTTLNALNWSLNADAAFDSIDSLSGASTTAKSGVALYNAATPVCREMAIEVCDSDELDIAVSGYQMQIEQDCNTVKKAYQTQTDTARQKVHEGSALLDMSRLDAYQTKNSDDILTCKSKMLEMLTDSTVCGEKLGKCLDTTGQYIDPSTGEAFLTVNLANLDKLITRPSGNQTWTRAPGNEVFVSFLNTKKKFLEPAMTNCQDISDYVWDAFIEDALAQIKLAQGSKLEQVRQSCTTLTTQCLSNAATSIAEFDARALSTFGVAADMTTNALCANVRNACDALLNDTDSETQWATGMTEIANEKTYNEIMHACREIGRACVIQACTSMSGNFGLCMDALNSTNRKAIIDRTACWDEVYNCVASAGKSNVDAILEQLGMKTTTGSTISYTPFYNDLYGNGTYYNNDSYNSDCDNQKCVYDYSSQFSNGNMDIYRIAESIWGNCAYQDGKKVTPENSDDNVNIIIEPVSSDNSTILSWLAKNTNEFSCTSNRCKEAQEIENGQCVSMSLINSSWYTGVECPVPGVLCCSISRMTPTSDGATHKNCCDITNIVNVSHDTNTNKTTSVCCNATQYSVTGIAKVKSTDSTTPVCAPIAPTVVMTDISATECGGAADLLCLGTDDKSNFNPENGTITCNGTYVYRCRTTGKIVLPSVVPGAQTGSGSYYKPNYYCMKSDTEREPTGTNECQLEYVETPTGG